MAGRRSSSRRWRGPASKRIQRTESKDRSGTGCLSILDQSPGAAVLLQRNCSCRYDQLESKKARVKRYSPVDVVKKVYRHDDRHDPLVNLPPKLLFRYKLIWRELSQMHSLLCIDVLFSDDIPIVKDFVVPNIRLWTVHGSCDASERGGTERLEVGGVDGPAKCRIPQKIRQTCLYEGRQLSNIVP